MSRVLVVEDEAHLAQGLRFNLEAEGHSVHVTDKGEEALTLLLKNNEGFDALILDVMLPGKDGFTVARELRQAQNYIPLLMLTARTRPEDVLQGFESGADDYLAKPFDLAILLARVESLLRRKNWLRNSGSAKAEPVAAADPSRARPSCRTSGTSTKIRIPAPSTTSSCVCAATSSANPRSRGTW
jgi:DNA-binding response OmpR family regulator